MPRPCPQFVVLAALASMLALAACNRTPSQGQAQAPALDQPTQTVPPTTSPMSEPGPARFDGYGDLRFGMTANETRSAWKGDLNGKPGKSAICYYLNPVPNQTPSDFALMIESDKFVRYDVGNDKDVAPGGGKRGMTADQIRKLYAGHLMETPHKYVDDGLYLRVKANDGSGGVLVFETDATGKVSQWHVGQPPAVDYVEGCS